MRKTVLTGILIVSLMTLAYFPATSCTNFLISKGASVDGSTMITYAADSHVLYGELYHWPAGEYKEGSLMDIYEWDTGKLLGQIKQVAKTYNVVGNMNENQVAIGETTYTGRTELQDTTGIIDYGSLIYITLQRATSARDAIRIMTNLVKEYGYYSTGESFSIADPNEVWILELIGKGPGNKGAVWVAVRIPDGYISGHANHARVTTFPISNKKTSISSKYINSDKYLYKPELQYIYAEDVVSFAKEAGYYEGDHKDFSFSDTYAPLDFGGARFCEARVWAAFNRVNVDMGQYVDYAMGHDLTNRMPLYIKPDKKLSVHDVMGLMRDYYQGTPMDMTKDVGAGPYSNIVRWRPLTWKVDGETYFNERATSTQQTGFSFVSQMRSWLPNPIGGIHWFGVDDAYSSVYNPIYCGSTEVPETYAVGNGTMMDYSENAAFWVFNQVSNFAYTRYNAMIPDIQEKQSELELGFFEEIKDIDQYASTLYQKDPEGAVKYVTEYSVKTANNTVNEWKQLYKDLFVKFMDGNIKTKAEPKKDYKYVVPNLEQPGYSDEWYKFIIEKSGDKFLYHGDDGH
jgi:dipeptidase